MTLSGPGPEHREDARRAGCAKNGIPIAGMDQVVEVSAGLSLITLPSLVDRRRRTRRSIRS